MLNQKQSDLGIGQPTKNIESEFLGLGITMRKQAMRLGPEGARQHPLFFPRQITSQFPKAKLKFKDFGLGDDRTCQNSPYTP